MKAFIIGLVLGVVLLAAGIVTPTMLRSSAQRAEQDGRRQAELARRILDGHSPAVADLGVQVALDRLSQAEPADLLMQMPDAEQIGRDFAARVQRARTEDRRRGMPETDLRAVTMNEPGLRAAVGSVSRIVSENHARLSRAVNEARAAVQSAPDALGVPEVLGAARLVEAHGLLAEARRARITLNERLGQVSELAYRYAAAASDEAEHAGADVGPVIAALQEDLADLEREHAETNAGIQEQSSLVAARQQELDDLRRQLAEVRGAMLSLQDESFVPGSDASFNAYRQRYLELAGRARALQEQEQLLAYGGRAGGTEQDIGLEFGHVEGGAPQIGLETHKRALDLAQGRSERLARGAQAVEEKIRSVRESGELSSAAAQRAAERRRTLRAEIDEHRETIEALAQTAMEKEEAALRAARDAAQAYRTSAQAHGRWIADARKTQQDLDKIRKNERLQRILEDNYGDQPGLGGEAHARLLAASIMGERLAGLASLQRAFHCISSNVPGAPFDAAALDEERLNARNTAIETLVEARGAYERLAGRSLPTNWVHQASLAAVNHLLSMIDADGAAQHRAAAVDAIRKAVANREHSPYLSESVQALAMQLTGGDLTPREPGAPSNDDDE